MLDTMTEPTVKLTSEQVDFFLREGYLSIPAITTPEEVARLRGIYDSLFERRAGREDGNQFDLGGDDAEGKRAVLPQILRPSKYAPELNHTLYRTNALALAKQLLGPQAELFNEHMIYKPARYGAATPWHQDQAYHQPDQVYRNVNIWMPLQEATVENGCMQFVPGSHKLDVLPHHPINNDPRVVGLEVDEPEKWAAKSVSCPIPAGGASMHHSYMLHYAGPNRSDVPRRAYILVYAVPPVKREKPLDLHWKQNRQTAAMERRKAAQARAAM